MKKNDIPTFPHPIHSNPSHDAEHVVYLGGTGSGKTSAVKYLGLVPKKAQALFFDPYRNYAGAKFQGQMCHGFTVRSELVKAVLRARRSGQPFKAAYIPTGGATMQELEFFSAFAWALGNGQAPKLHVVIEELASCAETSGKLKGKAGELLRGGRQYGHVIHTIFQKGQEVPKTVTDQSSVWWVGAVNATNDAQWVADRKGVDVTLITGLTSAKVNKTRHGKPIAEYLLIRDGIGNVTKGAINCATGQKTKVI
ncbi:hypothetical protein L1D34_27580 [Vibrio mediterranei]|uniref:hypothetical protein n=1 Tax=Vibrio mediterranei TaxID=689 RepID=UPI001EFCCD9A|nr:hypothetical protein [Vibrio mediterranei]MCG9628576.1 hypothetical protein [Vibrio mediterranei]